MCLWWCCVCGSDAFVAGSDVFVAAMCMWWCCFCSSDVFVAVMSLLLIYLYGVDVFII